MGGNRWQGIYFHNYVNTNQQTHSQVPDVNAPNYNTGNKRQSRLLMLPLFHNIPNKYLH